MPPVVEALLMLTVLKLLMIPATRTFSEMGGVLTGPGPIPEGAGNAAQIGLILYSCIVIKKPKRN